MKRRGMTLIEIVVLLLIFFILIALLLPALRRHPGVNARQRCASNLRQLMLASIGYEMAMHSLPPTASGRDGAYSMKSRMLPFMDEGDVYSALNFSLPFDDPANEGVRDVQIGILLCPSDPASDGGRTKQGSQSYPNNIGIYLNNNRGRLDGPAYELGAVVNGRPIRLADITDGTSTTVMFSESKRGSAKDPKKSGAIYWSTDADNGPIPVTTLAANCEAATVIASEAKGSDWLDASCGKGGGYSHIMTPNARACFFANGGFAHDRTMIGASSYHAGGVNVGMVDGSVRFVKDSINPATWRALSTIAGGESIDPESY